MLPLLHRYILKEVFVATLLAMGLFVLVLLLGNLLKDVASLIAAGKLGFLVFLKLIGLLVPYVASYALPMGTLTGALISLGRLSSQQEITAMKSTGLSLYQIAAPVFMIAFVGMVAGVLVNLHYAPQSRIAYKRMMLSAVSKKPTEFIEKRRFVNEFPGYVIYMGDQEGSRMKDFWIWVLDEKQRVKQFIRAREGTIEFDSARNSLSLTLIDATTELYSQKKPESFNTYKVDTLLFDQTSIELSFDEIFGGKNRKRAKIKELTFAQLMRERRATMAQEEESDAGMSRRRMKLQIHIQKNFAMAFSVFSLAIFGVPLAIQVGRKESYANLAIALVIAMSYYFLIIAVSWLEGNLSMRPDLLIWLPNIIFQALGCYMFQKASRH